MGALKCLPVCLVSIKLVNNHGRDFFLAVVWPGVLPCNVIKLSINVDATGMKVASSLAEEVVGGMISVFP